MSNDHQVITLTKDELRSLMAESIQEAFRSMGIESSSPSEMQRDFVHLRRWRLAVDSAQSQTFRVVVTTLAVGILGALWLGIQGLLNGGR